MIMNSRNEVLGGAAINLAFTDRSRGLLRTQE
jgi:hypothetical protein